MNILEIVSGTGIDGATRHGVLLSRELARRGNRVTLACRPGSWIAGQLHGESVRVVRVASLSLVTERPPPHDGPGPSSEDRT